MTDKLTIDYEFTINGERQNFALAFQPESMKLLHKERESPPQWTDLDYCQCSNCPLTKETHPQCPVALNLVDVLEFCSDLTSYQELDLAVTTQNRSVSARTTAQQSLSSLVGLIMATSDCPHTDFLRPLARFHLPLADEMETNFRILSGYLLGQYLRIQKGLSYFFDLQEIESNYKALETVNASLTQRFRSAVKEDATINAVILLDLFAKNIRFAAEECLQQFKDIYSHYLD